VRHKNQGPTRSARFSKKYVEARWKHGFECKNSASLTALAGSRCETSSPF